MKVVATPMIQLQCDTTSATTNSPKTTVSGTKRKLSEVTADDSPTIDSKNDDEIDGQNDDKQEPAPKKHKETVAIHHSLCRPIPMTSKPAQNRNLRQTKITDSISCSSTNTKNTSKSAKKSPQTKFNKIAHLPKPQIQGDNALFLEVLTAPSVQAADRPVKAAIYNDNDEMCRWVSA